MREGGKGDVLEQVFGVRDAMADSDQGRSFRAFWEFLMSTARQVELTNLLERVFVLDSVAELAPDMRMNWSRCAQGAMRRLNSMRIRGPTFNLPSIPGRVSMTRAAPARTAGRVAAAIES